jgi:hypothetical protein
MKQNNTTRRRTTRARAVTHRASVRAQRGKRCGCVSISYEEARLTAPVPYL